MKKILTLAAIATFAAAAIAGIQSMDARVPAGKVVEALIQAGERPYVIGCCVADDKNEGKGVDLKW